MIRVLLVDDEPMVCAHLRTILEADDGLVVAGEAHDGAEAVEACVRLRPDVVLLDLRMPGVDGLSALGRIAALPHVPQVVVLTTFDIDSLVLRAMRQGAVGYLLKSTAPADLMRLVHVAAAGLPVFSPEVVRLLVDGSAGRTEARENARRRIRDLTEREHDVLTGLADGHSNAEIAARLRISEATVKGHVSHLMVKLGCANRTQAGLIAQVAGLGA